MHRMKIILVLCAITKVYSDNCDKIPTINITVFETINSIAESITLQEGVIKHTNDAFHILVSNVQLPKLCQQSVLIENELSALQINNVSLQEILPGAFNITPTLTLLKLSYNLINNITSGIFNNIKVKEIDLSNNFITNISPDAFDNITNLEILKMNNNLIKEIDGNWFNNSPNVYSLSIVYNELTNVPPEAFKKLTKIRPLKINLSANSIFEISPNALSGHKNIEVLRMNGNKISSFPSELFVNRTVKALQVNSNKLKCFPDELFTSGIIELGLLENTFFECACLKKMRTFVEEKSINVLYPAIICEDRSRDVNIVFNFNKTYELPLMTPSADVDAYGRTDEKLEPAKQ